MPIYYVEQNGYAVSEVTTGSPGPDNSVENLANWPDTSIDLSKWYPGDDNRAPDQFIVGNSEIATPLDEAQRSLAGGVTGDRIQRFAIELRSILNGSQDEFATSGPVVDLSSTDYEWGMARIGVDKMRRLVYWEPVIVGEDILQFAVELNYIGQIFAYVVNREGIRLDYHVRHLSPEEAYDRQMYITGLLFPGIFMLNDKGARGFNSIRGDIAVMKGRANSDSSVGSSKSGALIELLDSLAPSATKAVRSDVFPLQFVLATQALYKTDRVDMSYFILNYLSNIQSTPLFRPEILQSLHKESNRLHHRFQNNNFHLETDHHYISPFFSGFHCYNTFRSQVKYLNYIHQFLLSCQVCHSTSISHPFYYQHTFRNAELSQYLGKV